MKTMIEPIRVLHMIGSLEVGGSQSMVINLHRAIDRSVVQFDYVIDRPDHLYFAEIVKRMGAKIYTMPTFKGRNVFEIVKAWNVFFKNHPEYGILHSHVRSYASLYLPIAQKFGLKTIIHSHSTSNGSGLNSVVKRVMQYPLRWQADYFFGCSKEAGEWLFGKKIVNSSKYHIIQNAIDSEKYRFDLLVRKKYRESLNLGCKKTFVHVGRFHPSKNHYFLLRLFAEIHKKNASTVLLLVGDGDLRMAIESQIDELGLKNDVILMGNRDDVPDILKASDCFLFPSVWEGFGMVALEAQAAGLPCICNTAVPRSVKVTDGCKFISTDDIEKWASEALNLVNVPINRASYVDCVRKAGFDINMSAKELERFYVSI